MIEPVVATALITSILALIAYYLQPQQPHHQSHYHHQIRRARVMADPQRRSCAGDVDRGAERRGREWEVYEQENGEGAREAAEWAIGVRELGLSGRGVMRSRLVLEEGVDAEEEKRPGVQMNRECRGSGVDGGNAAAVSVEELDMQTETASRGSSLPSIRITTPDSDSTSTILPLHIAEHETIFENSYSNTLDQQRRQRARFDEALRMHSYGGSQYVGRMVDKDVERRAKVGKEREEEVETET